MSGTAYHLQMLGKLFVPHSNVYISIEFIRVHPASVRVPGYYRIVAKHRVLSGFAAR